MKIVLKRLLPYLKDYKYQLFIAIIGMIATAIGTSASAYLVKPVLDEIFINKDKEMLKILPFLVILMYLLKGGGRFIQTYYTEYIGQDIIRRLRDKMLDSLLLMDMGYFVKQRSGELISRITNDINRIRNVVANMVPELLRESLTIIALTAVVIYQSPKLALYFLVIMPLAIYPLSLLAKRMKKISKKSQEKISDITSHLTEIFNNIEIIKSNVSEKKELERFKEHNSHFFNITMKSVKTSELVSPLMEVLGAIVVALVIIVGGNEVIEGKMSVGSFFSFMTALFMLYTPIKKVSTIYNKLQDAIAASERIFEIIDLKPTIKVNKNKFKEQIKDIKFENVSLYYDDKRALDNVSFTAKKREVIALVGDSGGGKSSIVNLLVRFYDPSRGRVLFNDKDIKDFDVKSIRKKIALVTQRIYIFRDTIAQNVAYGEDFEKERVIEALKLANAYEFVEQMEKGIYTELDEFGANLSGGQRQRIALARAIYKNPEVLILDEATSALDTKSEQKIQEALKNITKNKITFIVAHRLSTIQNADKILVMSKGKKICEGKHNELIKSCEEYQKLHNIFQN
ncbi:ABC transporter ATP-binding protein [Nitrosophilus labii]|uniref:ABC transporter ATP-binding protein n=1 Tax=Nitrosophilus labii TaxID=2706014 RepID=UPI0016569088|nr:ABC transporter ATP-binding protein [Nitrosophilus labii]